MNIGLVILMILPGTRQGFLARGSNCLLQDYYGSEAKDIETKSSRRAPTNVIERLTKYAIAIESAQLQCFSSFFPCDNGLKFDWY